MSYNFGSAFTSYSDLQIFKIIVRFCWDKSTLFKTPITTHANLSVFRMGDSAGFLLEGSVLFLWAFFSAPTESESDKFGFIPFEKGENFFRKTLKAISKDWNNSAIKRP